MTRDDVVRITEQVISELSVSVKNGNFTDPNRRTIVLKHKDKVISETTFDVVQTGEYEG